MKIEFSDAEVGELYNATFLLYRDELWGKQLKVYQRWRNIDELERLVARLRVAKVLWDKASKAHNTMLNKKMAIKRKKR